jgi:hypothetical protein
LWFTHYLSFGYLKFTPNDPMTNENKDLKSSEFCSQAEQPNEPSRGRNLIQQSFDYEDVIAVYRLGMKHGKEGDVNYDREDLITFLKKRLNI